MGILDALFGHKDDDQQPANDQARGPYGAPPYPQQPLRERPLNADEQALARYRYMLQTAPPEQIEAAHEEAFARLTPQQRQMALQQMTQMTPPSEAAQISDDPRSLARAATRAEMRQPGAMQRMFGGANATGQPISMGGNPGMMGGGGMMGGMGGMLAGSLLTSLAGGFIGSSIANSFFGHAGHEQAFQSSPEAQAVDGGVSDYSGGDFSSNDYNPDFQPTGLDSSADPYGDPGAGLQDTGLDSSADSYGDPGADSGGFDNTDFGGGDFGGGDFGGGDF